MTKIPRMLPSSVFHEENGSLLVLEMGILPFHLQRLFTVRAPSGTTRGQHAHHHDSQFLVAVKGTVEVTTHSVAGGSQHFILDNWNMGLYLPPMVWAQQRYLDSENILLVGCALNFNPDDYIRDPEEFRQLTGISIQSGF